MRLPYVVVCYSLSLSVGCGEGSTPATSPNSNPQITKSGVKAVKRIGIDKRQRIVHTPKSLGIDMKRIPAGSFMMGACEAKDCPKNQNKYQHTSKIFFDNIKSHRVTLTRPFLMATTEVTVEQFMKVQDSHERNLDQRPWQPDPQMEGPKTPMQLMDFRRLSL